MEDVSPTSKSQDFESPSTKEHRKSISTGGGRAWSQEEVRGQLDPLTQNLSSLTRRAGELPDRNPHAQDALQTHRRDPKEDRTGMPPTLPPALLW